MATWYVRKSGSNANAGTSASAAWLTIAHALTSGSGIAPGDSLYVGAGIYRENDTVGITGGTTVASGSNGGNIANIASWSTPSAGVLSVTSITAPPFPSSGTVTVNTTLSTTVASGSNGGTITSIATWGATYGGNGVLAVSSTTGFPTSGNLIVTASGGVCVVAYTGTSGGTSFTGCTYTGGNTGTVSTGSAITAVGFATVAYTGKATGQLTGCTLLSGGGTVATGLPVGIPINIVADVDGAKTGDAGEVRVTNYETNDTTAATNSTVFACGANSFLNFSLFTVVAGAANCVSGSGYNCSFTDCTLINFGTVAAWTQSSGLAMNLTFDRCAIAGTGYATTITLGSTNSGSADYDSNVVFRNCYLQSPTNASSFILGSGASTYKGGGVRFYSCTLVSGGMVTSTEMSTGVPCEANGCLLCCSTGVSANTSGQIVESYNYFLGGGRSNVTAGTGSISNNSYAPLIEIGQAFKWGAGTVRPFMAPTANSPLLGFGSASTGGNYPTVDWMNRPRPSGGGSANNAAGYLERHDFAVQDTSTYPSGYTSSGKLIGPGDQFLFVPVDAVSTTITIQVQMSSGYGGTNYATATILTNGELGVTTQTQTCSSTLGSFQTLTFSGFTPSKQGWVVVQVTSYDTSGTGNVWFGALT